MDGLRRGFLGCNERQQLARIKKLDALDQQLEEAKKLHTLVKRLYELGQKREAAARQRTIPDSGASRAETSHQITL